MNDQGSRGRCGATVERRRPGNGGALPGSGLVGCAGAGGGDGGGGSGQCNDGSLCGDRLDRDQDNLISPQEWDDAFNAADTDHDGVVSQTEFEAAGGNWGGGWTRSLKERGGVDGRTTL